ncbi:MAG: PP2C family protein-serine/threonine phosphatase [Spirochaetota bacterium]
MKVPLEQRLLEEEEFSIDKSYMRTSFYTHFLLYTCFFFFPIQANIYTIGVLLFLFTIRLLGFWFPRNRTNLNRYILFSSCVFVLALNMLFLYQDSQVIAPPYFYHNHIYYMFCCALIVTQAIRFNRSSIISVFIIVTVFYTIFTLYHMLSHRLYISIKEAVVAYSFFLAATVIGQLLYEAKIKAFHSYIDLFKQKTDVDKDLLLARNIQESLFPRQNKIPQLRYTCFRETHKHIGGDFYDFIHLREGNIGIFLTDVAGHGISSAMIAAMLKVMVSNIPYIYKLDPPALLSYLDKRLSEEFEHHHATALYLYLNFLENRVLLANAGHPYAIYAKKGEPFQEIRTSGTLMGFKMRQPVADLVSFSFEAGDRLFLYTDGIVECVNAEDEMLGPQGLLKILNKYRDNDIESMQESILQELKDYQQQDDFNDDAMFLLFELLGG